MGFARNSQLGNRMVLYELLHCVCSRLQLRGMDKDKQDALIDERLNQRYVTLP